MGKFAAWWGLCGVVALLSLAIYRLAEVSIASFQFEYEWPHWTLLAGTVVFMCYTEGYRGFQQAFSPRTAARARFLRTNPTVVRVVLAPLFCMGYFHTTRHRLIVTYLLTVGIIGLVVVFHQLAQPWRGVLDTGVVCGLIWGVISLLRFSIPALVASEFPYSPELPNP